MNDITERDVPPIRVNVPLQLRYKGRLAPLQLRLIKGRFGLVHSQIPLELKKQLVLSLVPFGDSALERVQLFARVEKVHPEKGLVELRWNKAVSPMGLKHLNIFLDQVLQFHIPPEAFPTANVSLREPAYFDFKRSRVKFPNLVQTGDDQGEAFPELAGLRPSAIEKDKEESTKEQMTRERMWDLIGKLDVKASTHHQGSSDAKGIAYRMAQQLLKSDDTQGGPFSRRDEDEDTVETKIRSLASRLSKRLRKGDSNE